MIRRVIVLAFSFSPLWYGCLGGSGAFAVSSNDPAPDPTRITDFLRDLEGTSTPAERLGVAARAFREAHLKSLSGATGREAYRAAVLAGAVPALREEVLLAGANLEHREAAAVLAEVARVASAQSRRRLAPGRTVVFALWLGDRGRRHLDLHPVMSSSVFAGERVIPEMDDVSTRGLEQAVVAYLDSLEEVSLIPDALLVRDAP